MKIIKEGTAHIEKTGTFNCKFCESEIRIINGDPRVRFECTSDSYKRILTKCPVCGQYIDETIYFIDTYLTIEDKEEMNSWERDKLEDFTDDDLEYIGDYDRIEDRRDRSGCRII